MAITAVKVVPANPEIQPDRNGLLEEIWRLTGDGATLSVTITTDSVRRIKAAIGANFTHNITTTSANQVTLTFYPAGSFIPNGLTQDVLIYGKA